MSKLADFDSVSDLQFNIDPVLDAWFLYFMTENDIYHRVSPGKNASPEQICFMVDLREDHVFAPCSDWMLKKLLSSKKELELFREYSRQWKKFIYLVRTNIQDEITKKRVIGLGRHKFRQVIRSNFLIPSRLMKQLITIFLTQSNLEDPMLELRKDYNWKAARFLESPEFKKFINICPDSTLYCTTIKDMRCKLDILELKRLLCLSTYDSIWNGENSIFANIEFKDCFDKINTRMDELEPILISALHQGPIKILYLPDTSGGLMIDIAIIKALIRQGHSVTLALNEGFYFDLPTFWDVENDPELSTALEDVLLQDDSQLSKNELLQAQRENKLLIISSGIRERLNLYRTNVTFARAWKESDLIFAKGNGNYRRLILNSHLFTRNIFCFYRDVHGQQHYFFKKRSQRSSKFTEKQIIAKADEIILQMRQARATGNRVMFYSAVIGSVPGQTTVAIDILNTFVAYLRSRLEGAFIINPAEHFESGMDGDDLMFMWERVQRSGLIDVWRFETVQDIEKSFELMGKKVPPIWNGKDATYSTGCTKEMHIALDEQKKHPELQIIGPDPEKFFRRREYGVGKFFDSNIERV